MLNTFYIETMGCQMNKLDSELVTGKLIDKGFQPTKDPDDAGLIIFNTCSVRQHAEDKVISKIGQLRRRHREQGDLILAVVGCMAERLGEDLIQAHAQVDIVCGPGQLHRLPHLVYQAQRHRTRATLLNNPADLHDLEQLDNSRSRLDHETPFAAYLRVMRGCNNFCTYCIVPYVRGRENSRPLTDILEESQRLVDNGVKEITLLGQAVNSYQHQNCQQTHFLADVLHTLHEIPGLQRLRFVTSYPKNFDQRILQAMADLPKVCEYLHMPAQSGSDRILKAMNRHYTAREYLDLVERARQLVPNFTIAGDFIVGYCGETEADFQATKDLVRQVRYKNCFIFKYSPRPGTHADEKMADNVPEDVKRRRNTELLQLQNEIALQDNQRFVNTTVEILVEGPSKKPHLNHASACDDEEAPLDSPDLQASPSPPTQSPDSPHPQLVGRTRGDHIVVLNAPENLIGQIITAQVTKASALTLFATLP